MKNPSPREKVFVYMLAMISWILVVVSILVQFGQPV